LKGIQIPCPTRGISSEVIKSGSHMCDARIRLGTKYHPKVNEDNI
jgi:hypothetical protein